MSYRPTYEYPDFYDVADAESNEGDWQDMPSEQEVDDMEKAV